MEEMQCELLDTTGCDTCEIVVDGKFLPAGDTQFTHLIIYTFDSSYREICYVDKVPRDQIHIWKENNAFCYRLNQGAREGTFSLEIVNDGSDAECPATFFDAINEYSDELEKQMDDSGDGLIEVQDSGGQAIPSYDKIDAWWKLS